MNDEDGFTKIGADDRGGATAWACDSETMERAMPGNAEAMQAFAALMLDMACEGIEPRVITNALVVSLARSLVGLRFDDAQIASVGSALVHISARVRETEWADFQARQEDDNPTGGH